MTDRMVHCYKCTQVFRVLSYPPLPTRPRCFECARRVRGERARRLDKRETRDIQALLDADRQGLPGSPRRTLITMLMLGAMQAAEGVDRG